MGEEGIGSALPPVEIVNGDGDVVPLFVRLSWVFNDSKDSRSLWMRTSFEMSIDAEGFEGLREETSSTDGSAVPLGFIDSNLGSEAEKRPLSGE